MGTKTIAVDEWTEADPATVFEVLADAGSWPRWSSLGTFARERAGTTELEGVGAIRHFTTGRVHSHEEVVVFDPPHHFAYVLLEGLPLRDYRADVRLEGRDGGTAIQWRSSFRPKIVGTGWLYRLMLGRFIAGLAHDLAVHTTELTRSRPSH